MSKYTYPIDAVFLWVDSSDPEWQQKKIQAQNKPYNTILQEEANQNARFRDNGELRYALRALNRFAPWINNVFIITDNQKPSWINTKTVNIISHQEIFPPEVRLPVFNTRPIEFCAHRIPNLAEHFLLFEDDFMLGREIRKKYFFTPEGKPLVWISKKKYGKINSWLSKKIHQTSHDATIATSHRLIRKKFGTSYPCTVRHFPKAMTKQTVKELWDTFPYEISQTLNSPFRSFDDVNITTLYPLYLIATKKGRIRTINGFRQLVDFATSGIRHIGASIGDDNFAHKINMIKNFKPLTFCLNDAQKADIDSRNKAIQFLQFLFPDKSIFER